MKRAARAYIDLKALGHNLTQARNSAVHSRVVAMVKADAYGHGLLEAAAFLVGRADALGVACLPEALALREAGIPGRILVTQGFKNEDELRAASRHELDVVVHEERQLKLLEHSGLARLPPLWIKVDSGMHRLGFAPERVSEVRNVLMGLSGLTRAPGFVTHFACADESGHPLNAIQLQRFEAATAELAGERSMANSAAVLSLPDAHRDWVRPGIMLYGSSPLAHASFAELNLKPVMSLRAPLIAINRHRRGESIGYGASYVCPEDMPVGIVAIGYGDGYPRHAGGCAEVSISGQRAPLAGRVSMDMLAVDLRGVVAQVGDEVELWGIGVSVDEVARNAQTISYELLCNAGSKSPRIYLE